MEHFDRVLAVNLRGAFVAAEAAIRHFLTESKPGVVINISSVHQIIPKPALSRLFRQQGRHAEPDPHAGAGVCRPRHPRQRHRAGRDDHAHQPGLGG
ncbi:MAG: SDR family NAD(P)-dependent oxidoreductase [Anaerolineae bacterium]